MERETGFEPATSTLARSHSTTELFPLAQASKIAYHAAWVPSREPQRPGGGCQTPVERQQRRAERQRDTQIAGVLGGDPGVERQTEHRDLVNRLPAQIYGKRRLEADFKGTGSFSP